MTSRTSANLGTQGPHSGRFFLWVQISSQHCPPFSTNTPPQDRGGGQAPHASVGPSWPGSAPQGAGHTRLPGHVEMELSLRDRGPCTAQVSAQQGLQGPLRLVLWIWVAPLAHKFTRRHPNTPKGGEEQPTATCEHPSFWRPLSGFSHLVSPFSLLLRRAAPHQKGKNKFKKRWLFLCWQDGPIIPSFCWPSWSEGLKLRGYLHPPSLCCPCHRLTALCTGARGRADQAALEGTRGRSWGFNSPVDTTRRSVPKRQEACS